MKHDDKVKILRAFSEKERRKRAAPLLSCNFELTVPQRSVTTSLKALRHRVIILGGGNRMGKSTWLSALCVCLIYGYWILPT
jgi:hypothetical protein